MFFVFFGVVFGFMDNNIKNNGIQYKIIPSNPAPGDYVFLEIYSNSFDLFRSNISYIVNGKLKNGGTGMVNFTYKLPEKNQLVKIKIIIKQLNGKLYKKEININLTSVDLIYEVDNPYRPPFYKGKSHIISYSKINFFAFPNFLNSKKRKLDPKTLIYH